MANYVLEMEKTHFIVFSKETKRGGEVPTTQTNKIYHEEIVMLL